MKKVLEGELLSIAHRVLKMKDADTNKLYIETRELYEKLQVLKFYQDNFSIGIIKDITENQIVDKLENSTITDLPTEKIQEVEIKPEVETKVVIDPERSQIPEELAEVDYPIVVDTEKEINTPIEEKIVEKNNHTEPIIEEKDIFDSWKSTIEKTETAIEQAIIEELAPAYTSIADQIESDLTEVNSFTATEEIKTVENTISEETLTNDPFDGFDFGEIEFIRVEESSKENNVSIDDILFEKEETFNSSEETNTPTSTQNVLFNVDQVAVTEPKIVKSKSLNDIYRDSIIIGLNDRIAFEKHLFDNSSEDLNRVLSQLNTVSTFDEAMSFIDHLVKPEYNNWEGKDEYAERFVNLIEKKFA